MDEISGKRGNVLPLVAGVAVIGVAALVAFRFVGPQGEAPADVAVPAETAAGSVPDPAAGGTQPTAEVAAAGTGAAAEAAPEAVAESAVEVAPEVVPEGVAEAGGEDAAPSGAVAGTDAGAGTAAEDGSATEPVEQADTGTGEGALAEDSLADDAAADAVTAETAGAEAAAPVADAAGAADVVAEGSADGTQPTDGAAAGDAVAATPEETSEGASVAAAETNAGATAGAAAEGAAAEGGAADPAAAAPDPEGLAATDVAAPVPPDAVPDAVGAPLVTAAAEAATEPAATPDTVARPDASAAEAGAQPVFDLVRIEQDGSGIVAGRAEPGTVVSIQADGREIASAEVSARGEFVAFVEAPPSDEGARLSLVARTQLGGEVASDQEIIVLPVIAAAAGDTGADAPVIVEATDDAVRMIQPSGGLGDTTAVTLDMISYDDTGAVVLAGRGPGGRAVRVYLDDAAAGEAGIGDGGSWQVTLADVAVGRYRLRVDQLSGDGTVESRVESPFERVAPEIAAAFAATPGKVTVQPGNSLWVLARERYGQGVLYSLIYAANDNLIRDPDLIYPGQIFDLPANADAGAGVPAGE
jgi:nucleoid-associated protein YgaU